MEAVALVVALVVPEAAGQRERSKSRTSWGKRGGRCDFANTSKLLRVAIASRSCH